VPRLDDPLPRFIDDAAAAKLLRAARAQADPFARLTVEFLARTGLRRGEFVNLTIDSVVQIGSAYWLHVPLGKMHTDRYIPLHPQLKELLDAWVAERPAGLREPWLFMHRGRRIGVRRVEQAVANVAREAGIGHLTPHQLRHTLATQAINRGMSLEAIAALLGHKSMRMTMVYAKIANRTVAEEYFAVSEKVEALYDQPKELPASAEGAEMRKLRGPEIGLVFQEPMTRLDPLMRISDHFAEALRSHDPDISDAEVRRRSLEALGGVGIPPTRFRNYPYEFSGGMRQRIMIALALVFRPRFVVADEPTTSLDVLVEAQILSIIADLKRNFDASLLLITHNLGIVAESCDRVAVMYAGRIVEQGTVDDIFSRPEHPYTQELMRSTISLSTRELHFIPGAPPDLVEPPSGCRFHPRCPAAMRVCAASAPIGTEVRPGHIAECWLHGPADHLTPDDRVPLEREEIGIADEA